MGKDTKLRRFDVMDDWSPSEIALATRLMYELRHTDAVQIVHPLPQTWQIVAIRLLSRGAIESRTVPDMSATLLFLPRRDA